MLTNERLYSKQEVGWGSCTRALKRSKDVYKNRLRNRITETGKNIKVMEEHLQCSKLILLAR